MAWARLDDGLIDHPKFNELMEDPDGWAAFGFWSAMLIWANKHTRKPGKTPGLLKRADVSRMDRGQAFKFAGLLTKTGFWDLHPEGWMIHDFEQFMPSWQKLEAQRENGRKGGIAKARSQRKLATGQDSLATGQEKLATPWPSSSQAGYNPASHGLATDREGTSVSSSTTGSQLVPVREDVERLCARLADAIEDNGSKRPVISKDWRDACRLLLDKDGKTEQQVASAIDWCQQDEFWRANVLSMPTLRRQYDKLRLAAQRGRVPQNGQVRQSSTDRAVYDALSLDVG